MIASRQSRARSSEDSSVVSQINFDKQTCFSLGTFPSLQRGGCGINQKSRSHRRAADGVVAHATRFTNDCEASLVSDHPVRAFFRNGSILLLMARPPLL